MDLCLICLFFFHSAEYASHNCVCLSRHLTFDAILIFFICSFLQIETIFHMHRWSQTCVERDQGMAGKYSNDKYDIPLSEPAIFLNMMKKYYSLFWPPRSEINYRSQNIQHMCQNWGCSIHFAENPILLNYLCHILSICWTTETEHI